MICVSKFIFVLILAGPIRFGAPVTLNCDLVSDYSEGRPYCFIRHVKVHNEYDPVQIGENDDADEKREMIFDDCSFVTLPLGLFERFPQVKTLYTWNSGLQKLSRGALQNATQLTTLDLAKNRIANLTSSLFALAPNLEQVELTSNALRLIDEDAFVGLTRLRLLYLDLNLIESLAANTFRPLGQLQTIRLNNNRITSIPVDLFAENLLLANIYLHENRIESLSGERTFAHLNNVQDFDLHSNPIKGFSNCVINAQSIDIRRTGAKGVRIGARTERLTAADNQISFVEIGDASARVLQVVDLANNSLGEMQNLSRCEALTYLDLSHNAISDFGIVSFATMRALEVLKLRDSGLRALHYGLLSHKPKLRLLDISFNQLVDIDFDMFMSLGNLRSLLLEGNNITNMDMSEVRKVFPSLTKIGIAKNNWHCTELASAIKYLESNGISLNSIGFEKSSANIRGIPCSDPKPSQVAGAQSTQATSVATARPKPQTPHRGPAKSELQIENGSDNREATPLRNLNFIVKLMEMKLEALDSIKRMRAVARMLQEMLDDVRDNK